ncbi:MAG: hypothetical protein ACRD1V_11575, partial [Vicinamibacterales bacterium]
MSAPAAFAAAPLLVGVAAGLLFPSVYMPGATAALAIAWIAACAAIIGRRGVSAAAAIAVGCVAAGAMIGARAQQTADRPTLIDWFERSGAASGDLERVTGVLREDAARTSSG